MGSWKGKTRGGVLGHQIFVFILTHFDIRIAYAVLRFVALYFVLFAPKAFKSIYTYFHEMHRYGRCQSLLAVYRNYYQFGQVLLDKMTILAGVDAGFSYDFEGEDYLRQLAREKKGALLVGAHVGNWEMAGNLLKRLDCKVNVVMYDQEHEKIKKALSSMTDSRSFGVIVVKNDLSHVFEINNALKNGEFVCIHGDRFIDGVKTLQGQLLGKSALFPEGPFFLASKFAVPITYVYAMKENSRHYHYNASEPKLHPFSRKKEERNTILNGVLTDYCRELEKIVLQYPEQWFNYYDFWSQDSHE